MSDNHNKHVNYNIDKSTEKQDKSSTVNCINSKNSEKDYEDTSITSEIILNSDIINKSIKCYNNDNMDETELILNDDHFEQFKNESQFFENYVFTQTQQSTPLNNNNNTLINKNNSIDKVPFLYDNSQLSLNKEKKYVNNNFEMMNQKSKVHNEKINTSNAIKNVKIKSIYIKYFLWYC